MAFMFVSLRSIPISQLASEALEQCLEVHRHFDVLDAIRNTGITTADSYKHDNGKVVKELLVVDFKDLHPSTSSQDAACRILREHLKKHGVEVKLSTKLLSLEQDADWVTATIANEGAE